MSPRASEPPEPLDPLQTGTGHKVVDEVEALEELLAQVVEQSQASPQRMGDGLRGRCAVVTGGASGIGRGVVVMICAGRSPSRRPNCSMSKQSCGWRHFASSSHQARSNCGPRRLSGSSEENICATAPLSHNSLFREASKRGRS